MKTTICTATMLVSLAGTEAEALAQPSPTAPLAAAPTTTAPAPEPAGPDVTAEPKLHGGAPLFYLGTRNFLRTSYFNWTTSASDRSFGPGREYTGSESPTVAMSFAFAPRFSFVNTRDHWAWAGTNIAWSVELTNSGTTTDKHPVEVSDLPIDVAYSYTFVRNKKGFALLAGPRFRFTFPTSEASRSVGIYGYTWLGAGASASLPLLGGNWLNGLFVSAGGGFHHLFSKATTPVSGDGGVPVLQALSGRPRTFDQPSGHFFVRNRISMALSYWLNVWGDLSFGNTWGIQVPFSDSPSGTECINIATGCATVGHLERSTQPPITTVFDVSLSYAVADLVWIQVGYDNTAPSIGYTGQRRSVFYSPDAQFYVSGTLFFDSAYAKIRDAVDRKKAARRPEPSFLRGGPRRSVAPSAIPTYQGGYDHGLPFVAQAVAQSRMSARRGGGSEANSSVIPGALWPLELAPKVLRAVVQDQRIHIFGGTAHDDPE